MIHVGADHGPLRVKGVARGRSLTVLSNTMTRHRSTVSVSRDGITVTHWRPSTRGGWYPRHSLIFPWWWVK